MEFNVSNIEDTVDILSREISDSGQTLKKIAKGCDLNIQTVSKLYYKETRRPHYRTIMRLLIYFGYGVFVRKTNMPVELPAGVRRLDNVRDKRLRKRAG